MLEGAFEQTVELAERGADAAAEADDDVLRAFALNMLAIGKYELGDTEEAELLFEETAGLLRSSGDVRDLSLLHGNLGSAALLSGDYARARSFYESALALSEELGDRGRLPSHHQAMGVAALLDGSLDEAALHLSAALVDGRQVGDTQTVICALHTVAGLAAARGNSVLAATLRPAVDRATRDLGITLSGADVLVDRRFFEPPHATTSETLTVSGGEAMTLEEAFDAAVDELRLPSRPVH